MAPSATVSSASTPDPKASLKPATSPSLLHRSLLEQPHTVASASGRYLTLSDGRQILDGCGGAAVAIIGHGNAEVMAGTVAQMQKVSYIHTQSYTTSSAEDLATFLLHDPTSSFEHGLEKAYFCGSGSEANDSAMKLARQYWLEKGEGERTVFVARSQSYHGSTVGAMSISGMKGRRAPYEGCLTLGNVAHVAPAFAYRYKHDGETEGEYAARLVHELDDEFQRVGPGKVIAFVAETVVGAASGCVAAPVGYFAGVRRVCDKYGILLILDEVMCGMGRTGTTFAFEQEDVIPDIVTIGKGLGSGYAPIAAVLVGKMVIDALRSGSSAFNHGHTYQAHPVSCATALAVQKIVRREGLVEQCRLQGIVLERLLRERLSASKYVGDIRGSGLFWGIEFVKDRKRKESFDPEITFGLRVQKKAFELGVAVYPGSGTADGVRGDHVLVCPPFDVTLAELVEIAKALGEAYDWIEQSVDGF